MSTMTEKKRPAKSQRDNGGDDMEGGDEKRDLRLACRHFRGEVAACDDGGTH